MTDRLDWKETAVKLWGLLDNIDTLDDACRDDDAAFRRNTRREQRKRMEIIGSDGYSLTYPGTDEAIPGTDHD